MTKLKIVQGELICQICGETLDPMETGWHPCLAPPAANAEDPLPVPACPFVTPLDDNPSAPLAMPVMDFAAETETPKVEQQQNDVLPLPQMRLPKKLGL